MPFLKTFDVKINPSVWFGFKKTTFQLPKEKGYNLLVP